MRFDLFYVTDLGLQGFFFVYVPLTIYLAWFFYRRLFRGLSVAWLRFGIPLVLLGLMLAAPVWDVYRIGQESKRLCREQAGLHVFKTVEAEGLAVGPDIDHWSRDGFRYTESYGRKNKKFRYAMVREKVHEREIAEFSVRYGFIGGESHTALGRHHARTIDRVGDIQTHEVLGEFVRIKTYPGWLDSTFIRITGTGSGFKPWLCGKEPPPGRAHDLSVTDLVLATIKPRTSKTGESK